MDLEEFILTVAKILMQAREHGGICGAT